MVSATKKWGASAALSVGTLVLLIASGVQAMNAGADAWASCQPTVQPPQDPNMHNWRAHSGWDYGGYFFAWEVGAVLESSGSGTNSQSRSQNTSWAQWPNGDSYEDSDHDGFQSGGLEVPPGTIAEAHAETIGGWAAHPGISKIADDEAACFRDQSMSKKVVVMDHGFLDCRIESDEMPVHPAKQFHGVGTIYHSDQGSSDGYHIFAGFDVLDSRGILSPPDAEASSATAANATFPAWADSMAVINDLREMAAVDTLPTDAVAVAPVTIQFDQSVCLQITHTTYPDVERRPSWVS